MDEIWRRDNKGWHRWERPGPFCFMPIAVSVQGGAHLLLAVLERMVVDLGGCVAYRDTDSSLVPVSPEGGTLADGRLALSYAELEGVLRAFEPLSPEPCWPVWKAQLEDKGAPLQTLVFGQKKGTSSS